jgi:hypothetical protein
MHFEIVVIDRDVFEAALVVSGRPVLGTGSDDRSYRSERLTKFRAVRPRL